jgi:hypothetical protein
LEGLRQHPSSYRSIYDIQTSSGGAGVGAGPLHTTAGDGLSVTDSFIFTKSQPDPWAPEFGGLGGAGNQQQLVKVGYFNFFFDSLV